MTGRALLLFAPLLALATACSPIAAAPSASVVATPTATASGESGTVTKVTDGDTLHVLVDGRDETVRVLGVDTPETRDPRKPVQCFGPEASANAHRVLDGQRVTLTPDPTQDDRDKYGRELRFVALPDGSDYGLETIRAGLGRYYLYDRPVQRAEQYREAQAQAQGAGVGLWAPRPQGCGGGV